MTSVRSAKLDLTALFWPALSGARSLMGLLWLISLRWKLPPDFSPPAGMNGLRDWLNLMVAHPTLGIYADLVSGLVIPNFTLFAWLIFLAELVTALLLLSGFHTRAAALLGLLMSLNLGIGLAEVPGEWPWAYAMMAMWHGLLFVSPVPKLLGLDRWLRNR